MSRFFASRNAACVPYVPGEQPRDRSYIKLNTNESPFKPAPSVIAAIEEAAPTLNLYSDPTIGALRARAAAFYGVSAEEVTFSNGSDEMLNLAFQAFADETHPLRFPDLTYSFYKVAADAYHLPWQTLPLDANFRIHIQDYLTGSPATIVLANPNAPTGLFLDTGLIEQLCEGNPDGVVIVDEAYIDFGGESCIPLIRKHDNLLVIQTFSKSRSLAGARIGLAVGAAPLIADLETLRCATVPYNLSTMAQKAAIAAYDSDAYYKDCCRQIVASRTWTLQELRKLGFDVTDSMTNFVLARHPRVSGGQLYALLREKGILVRHLSGARVSDYVRITIGAQHEMEAVIDALRSIPGIL